MKKRCLFTAALALGAGLPAIAFAGGFEVPDNVTRAMGRGGAYVAAVDEPSAIYFNPAGLHRIDGFATTLNLNLVNMNLSFARSPYAYEDGAPGFPTSQREIQFDEIENAPGLQVAPMIFMSHDFGLERWTFGLGIYGPSAFGIRDFPSTASDAPHPSADDRDTPEDERFVQRDGGQQYMMMSESILLFYPSLSAAYNFESIGLTIGLTAQLAIFDGRIELAAEANGFDSAFFDSRENPATAAVSILETTGLTATGILGVQWDASDSFTIGASYRPRFNLHTTGTLELGIPESLSGVSSPELDNDAATLDTRMPDVIRAGVMYRHPQFNVSSDFVYEGWSRMDEFVSEVQGTLFDDTILPEGVRIPTLRLPRNYKDVFSFRLGAEFTGLLDEEGRRGFVPRIGGYYETGASPNEYTNIDFVSFNRISGSVGASYHFGAVSVDAGFSYIVSPERVVENGQYELLVPLWVCGDPNNTNPDCADAIAEGHNPSHAVNNGTYNVNYQIYSLGMTYGW